VTRDACMRFPRDFRSPLEARRRTEAHLRAAELGEGAMQAALLTVSELVTNAYKYGRGTIELRLRLADDGVLVEVIDDGAGDVPHIRESSDRRPGGWGLRIVDRLAVDWGVSGGRGHVWALLPRA
jgi:anti-sigma regulatory factor (Ser/Thr protein kinase)